MTKRIKKKISLLLLSIQLFFTFFLPLSPLIPQALASENTQFQIEEINESYSAYYLVDGVVFAEQIAPNGDLSLSSESGKDKMSYDADRLVIKTDNTTYLLENKIVVSEYSSDSTDLSTSDKDFLFNTWTVNGLLAETKEDVELGVTYTFPLNSEVKVSFTKLPEKKSPLRIEEVILNEETQKNIGALSSKVYDITTDMNDGEFEFNLVLPMVETDEKVEVKYAETLGELESSPTRVENNIEVQGNKVEIENLDHMTLFVVVLDNPTTDMTATGAESFMGAGSWLNNPGSGKMELYVYWYGTGGFNDTAFNIEDIETIEYHTLKDASTPFHLNFYMSVYTMPYGGSPGSSWYGDRLTLEPEYSLSKNEIAGTWTKWSTNAGDNQLTLFDSNRGNFGFYNPPTLDVVQAGSLNWGNYPTSGTTDIVDYASQQVKGISLSTGSAWDAQMLGYLDAVTITLKGGDSLTVDLETEDTTAPNVSNIKMFVNGTESTFMRPGDFVRVEADITDDSSGVGSVRLLAKNASGGGYIDSGYFVNVGGDKYAREFTFPADGKYIDLHTPITTDINGLRFYIKAFDNAGNYTNSPTTSFTYDKVIPSMNDIKMYVSTDGINYIEKDVVKAGDFVRVEVIANDLESGVKNVEFRIQNKTTGAYVAPRAYEATPVSGNTYRYSFQIPTDGKYINTHGLMSEVVDEHTFWARATDKVGNYHHGIKGEFTYDITAPIAPTLLSPADGSYVNGAVLLSDWTTVSDATHYIYESYHDAAASNLRWHAEYSQSEKTANHVGNSTFWWRVKAVDAAGNESSWSDLWKVTVDNDAPIAPTGLHILDSLGNDLGCGGVTNNRNITIDWDDSLDLGFDHFLLDLKDKDAHKSLTKSIYKAKIRDLDGFYKYKIREVDLAGNTSVASEWCGVTLDRVAPAVPSLTSPADGAYVPAAGLYLDWTDVTDPNGPVTYYYQSSYSSAVGANNALSSVIYSSGVLGSSKINASGSADNQYYWQVKACDAASNCSDWSGPWKVTIDSNAPDVQITNPLTGFLGGMIEVRGTLVDDNPYRYYAVIRNSGGSVVAGPGTVYDSSPFTNQKLFDWDTSLLADGDYLVHFAARDKAMNRDAGSQDQVAVTVDNTKPTSSIDEPAGASVSVGVNETTVITNSWDGNLTGTAIDNLSGVKEVKLSIMRSNGEFWNGTAWVTGTEANTRVLATGTTSWSYTDLASAGPLAEDIYTVKSHAEDNAGNIEDTFTLIVILDKTIPEVSLTIDPSTPDGENGWYKTRPTVTLTAVDPSNSGIKQIEYQWDGQVAGSWTVYSTPIQTPSEGIHNLYYRSLDKAGNYSSDVGIKTLLWDQTGLTEGPLNVDATPDRSGGPDAKVTWEAASDNIGIDHYKVTWDLLGGGADFSEIVGSDIRELSTNKLHEEGTWKVTVSAYDAAGHELSGSDEIVIDKEAPAAPVLELGDTRDGEVDLSWSVIDDADSYIIFYGLEAGNYLYAANVGNTNAFTVEGLGSGDYYFVVRAMDSSKNQSVNSNEVSTALTGVGGVLATGFGEAAEVLGVEDEATEEEQKAQVEEINGQVAGASTCDTPGYWFWLVLGLTFILVFASSFFKGKWNKVISFILIPLLAYIAYGKFWGDACFNNDLITWMSNQIWVPAYMTAFLSRIISLLFVEE